MCGGMKRICHHDLNYSKSPRKLRSRACSSESSCSCEASCSCSMSSSSLASASPILVSSSSSCKTWCRHCLQTRSSHMGVQKCADVCIRIRTHVWCVKKKHHGTQTPLATLPGYCQGAGMRGVSPDSPRARADALKFASATSRLPGGSCLCGHHAPSVHAYAIGYI